MKTFNTKLGTAYNADCFEVMKMLPNGCVDMILADLPYGTTACKWDTVIPFEPIWKEFHRIAKPNAAIVLTANQPFTSVAVMSNIKEFSHCWFWKKRPVNFLNAKKQPMRNIEDVLVFGKNLTYNPQGLVARVKVNKRSNSTATNGLHGKENVSEFTNYPQQVIEIINGERGLHPTQKPVALFEYLIKTYTNEGQFVFDPTAGSLTTGVAAENLNRHWVCVEQLEEYFDKGIARFKSE
jgi:site-specific DNA-methyltransferase (adenine-specific)